MISMNLSLQSGRVWLLVLFASCFSLSAFAQFDDDPARWKKDIAKFSAEDKNSNPQKDVSLFVGSSSIRMWNLKKWFPEQPVLNRGFGGSQISDSIHYFDELIAKHKPKTILFYAGDNDIAKGKSPARVFADYKKLVGLVEKKLPNTQLVFIAIKPSLSRWKLVQPMREANQLIREYSQTKSNLHYADIDTPMIGSDDLPRADLFKKDGLHLNEKGYKIWTDVVKQFVK